MFAVFHTRLNCATSCDVIAGGWKSARRPQRDGRAGGGDRLRRPTSRVARRLRRKPEVDHPAGGERAREGRGARDVTVNVVLFLLH